MALGLSLASATLFAADKYSFGGKDAAHAEIGFVVSHWMISKVRGNFDKFEGEISYDEKKVENSKVSVTIDTTSIDTRNERRDGHLRSADFFEAEKYPTATFKSTKVEKSSDGKGLSITGDFTLKGVTKSIVLDAVITGKMIDDRDSSLIGFEAKTKIKRTDYGIAWNKVSKTGTAMLGDEVKILLSGEATKNK